MNKYSLAFLGAIIVAACAWTFLAQPAAAEDKSYLTLEEAGKLGITVKLITPKPKVVYATLRFTELPHEAQLVICDKNEKWIGNASMAVNNKACTAWLGEEYVAKSYFLVMLKPGGTGYHIPLR